MRRRSEPSRLSLGSGWASRPVPHRRVDSAIAESGVAIVPRSTEFFLSMAFSRFPTSLTDAGFLLRRGLVVATLALRIALRLRCVLRTAPVALATLL